MQSTPADCSPAILPDDAALLLNVTPGFLTAAFATVSDPRRCQGGRYPLAAIVATPFEAQRRMGHMRNVPFKLSPA
ncbi:MAG TPA: hypothetical protein VMW65_10550 [Chloroflexota bacterium]|nr:hypothetical protein [Chloroflexota bacterium]